MDDFIKKALSADTPVMKRIVKFKRSQPRPLEIKPVNLGIPVVVVLLGGAVPVIWLALKVSGADVADENDVGFILAIVWLFLWPFSVAFLYAVLLMFVPGIRRYNQCVRIQTALMNTKGVIKPVDKAENLNQLKDIAASFDLDGLSKTDNKRFFLIFGVIVLVSLPIQYWILA